MFMVIASRLWGKSRSPVERNGGNIKAIRVPLLLPEITVHNG